MLLLCSNLPITPISSEQKAVFRGSYKPLFGLPNFPSNISLSASLNITLLQLCWLSVSPLNILVSFGLKAFPLYPSSAWNTFLPDIHIASSFKISLKYPLLHKSYCDLLKIIIPPSFFISCSWFSFHVYFFQNHLTSPYTPHYSFIHSLFTYLFIYMFIIVFIFYCLSPVAEM